MVSNDSKICWNNNLKIWLVSFELSRVGRPVPPGLFKILIVINFKT